MSDRPNASGPRRPGDRRGTASNQPPRGYDSAAGVARNLLPLQVALHLAFVREIEAGAAPSEALVTTWRRALGLYALLRWGAA